MKAFKKKKNSCAVYESRCRNRRYIPNTNHFWSLQIASAKICFNQLISLNLGSEAGTHLERSPAITGHTHTHTPFPHTLPARGILLLLLLNASPGVPRSCSCISERLLEPAVFHCIKKLLSFRQPSAASPECAADDGVRSSVDT